MIPRNTFKFWMPFGTVHDVFGDDVQGVKASETASRELRTWEVKIRRKRRCEVAFALTLASQQNRGVAVRGTSTNVSRWCNCAFRHKTMANLLRLQNLR